MTETGNWLRIERDFAAPIGEVWRMWTDPALFRQWYGPIGMSVPVAEMDLVVGGLRKICMEMKRPDRTMAMWFTGVFKEIRPVSRLVYTESMCDADGRMIAPASMGMPETTPTVTEVTVELSESDCGTHMTMIHVGVPPGTAGEGGWRQAFDKLSAVFAAKI
jgi:uncharacterized protein YndB with AHSA1/START domain